MKQSKTVQSLQKFVYIDSSQEDEPQNNQHNKQNKLTRVCNADITSDLCQSDFKKQLLGVVKSQIQKLKYGNAILVEPNDKEIAQNVAKRHQKYQYFLKQMEIDQKYNKILDQKVEKVRKENERKKQVLKKKKIKEMYSEQEDKFQKYLIQKREKEEKIMVGLNKVVHVLGVERNIQTSKQIKKVVEQERIITHEKLDNLRNKQKNQLQQLRQKYQAIKVQKRINKSDQEKVLRDLQIKNSQVKKSLQEQLKIRKDFII